MSGIAHTAGQALKLVSEFWNMLGLTATRYLAGATTMPTSPGSAASVLVRAAAQCRAQADDAHVAPAAEVRRRQGARASVRATAPCPRGSLSPIEPALRHTLGISAALVAERARCTSSPPRRARLEHDAPPRLRQWELGSRERNLALEVQPTWLQRRRLQRQQSRRLVQAIRSTGTRCSSWSASHRNGAHRVDEDYSQECRNAVHSVRHREPIFSSSTQFSRTNGAEVRCATALAGMAFQNRAEGTVWRGTRRLHQTPEAARRDRGPPATACYVSGGRAQDDVPAWLPASRVAAR
jgi:hypothetical protein